MRPEESLYPAGWRRIGEKDLRRVEHLLGVHDPEAAGFYLQQALEKFLKAFLLSKGWELKRIHDLETLLNAALVYDPSLEPYRAVCQKVTGFYMVERYPLMTDMALTEVDVHSSLEQAGGLIERLRAAFPQLRCQAKLVARGQAIMPPDQIERSLQTFRYGTWNDFDKFWAWKLEVERGSAHILDRAHQDETAERLCGFLRGWLVYRGCRNPNRWQDFRQSLRQIPEAYDSIRRYSLLEFSSIPQAPLEFIWHELGRVKEADGQRTQGNYYVIAVCKPLMFLWGQTLSFDSQNRKHIPGKFGAPRYHRWDFAAWKGVLERFQRELNGDAETVKYMEKVSEDKYGTAPIVPYGRFLDILYF